MREIKFRGMSPYYGWVYGMYVDSFIVNGVVEATDEYIALEEWYPIDIDTVGQYTGLKDKNGVEIYEGDIVNVHWFYANHDPETLGVYEDETNLECVEIIGVRGALGFYFEDDFLPLAFVPTHEESFEVIGNVYEDKELLEVE